MPGGERSRATGRGALLIALCGLACVAAVAMAIRAWRAAIAPLEPVAGQGPGAQARFPAGEAPAPNSPGAGARTASDVAPAPPLASTRRHRRGHAPAALGAGPLEPLGAQLTAELSALRPQLEACTRAAGADENAPAAAAALGAVQESALRIEEPSLSPAQKALLADLGAAAHAASREAMPRSLRLDVEIGNGEVRIVGVADPGDGSAFYRCAEKELTGRTVASPGTRAGRRISVVLPL